MTSLPVANTTRSAGTAGLAKPSWSRDGADWPNRQASQFVRAAGIDWHVQRLGSGPPILLLHGTGAATHSWAGLAPLLASRFSVIAPDLPGHGFTSTPSAERLSLPGMAEALAALLQALAVAPRLAVGHSAGAAILARMSLDRQIAPDGLVSLNGAILPLGGLPGHLFSPVARLCAGSALLPRLFAWHAAQRNVVENLLRDTGSRLDPAGIEFYRRLFRRPGHVAAALGMMAAWDLRPLARDLPRLQPPLAQLIGANDRTIPPRDAARVRALVRSATLDLLPGLGHLAHEEAPMTLAPLILRHAVLWGVLPS